MLWGGGCGVLPPPFQELFPLPTRPGALAQVVLAEEGRSQVSPMHTLGDLVAFPQGKH